ncbi:rod shape-determining protein MreC [Coxiella endosymbiont of Amblyomma sculptum]|uniref:rod shape-determining protein MreC n=1 Tax=Coxiella endosymbiont of Amblyomma sculptum TaxID=2487929 RepID=UPI00210FC576|nr:rod shape-determining protein MreC [Coxiella endosymbiont of Amblyomma sculptum]
MFRRSPISGLRVLSYIGLSIVLIFFDWKVEFFQKIRNNLLLIVFPIQYLVDAPIKAIHWITAHISTQQLLIEENTHLRTYEWLLEARLQKFLALKRENTQLRKLLESTSQLDVFRVLLVQLLSITLDSNLQRVVIDKGSRFRIYVGQPVLDAHGIVGQVVRVNPLTSEIMLISDPRSAVPIQDYRNGVHAVAVGTGNSRNLSVINVTDTSDIRKGDLFISSGLGFCYPMGYPVGVVSQIVYNLSNRFIAITLQPSARLNQLQQVLLVWPKKERKINSV